MLFTFTYDNISSGNLISIQFPKDESISSQRKIELGYAGGYANGRQVSNGGYLHNLTRLKDTANGNVLFWSYQGRNVVYTGYEGNREELEFNYNTANTTIVTSLSGGIAVTYTLEQAEGEDSVVVSGGGCSSCGGGSPRHNIYYPSGLLKQSIATNGEITYYGPYDSLGRPSYVEYYHAGDTPGVSTPFRRIAYSYYPPDAPATQETIIETSVYGAPYQKTTVKTYNDRGMLTSITISGYTEGDSGTQLQTQTTTYTYDSTGRRLIEVNGPRTNLSPNDDKTTYTYYSDNDSNYLRRGAIATVTNALGHITRYDNYTVFGHPKVIVDPNGVTTTYTGNVYGLTKMMEVNDGSSIKTTTYTYDYAGKLATVTTPSGVLTEYSYDSIGNTIKVTRKFAGNIIEYMEYEYDNESRKISEKTLDAQNTLKKAIYYQYGSDYPNYPNTNYTITYYGSNYSAPHATDVNDLAGNLLAHIDENGNLTRYFYDDAGKMIEVRKYSGSQENPSNLVSRTQYSYDNLGNLVEVKVWTGTNNYESIQYFYDDFGRLVKVVSPEAGEITYAYDTAGNLIQKKEWRQWTINSQPQQVTTTYTYDALNRLSSITYPRGDTVSYTYDETTDSEGFNHGFGIGRLTTVTEPSGTTKYKYDSAGNIVQTRFKFSSSDYYDVYYTYDNAGMLRSITYPSGRVVEYLPSAQDPERIATIKVDGHTIAQNISYDPFGDWDAMALGNGMTAIYQRDLRGLPQRVAYLNPTVMDYRYTTDSAGNITAIEDITNPSWNRYFAYDALNQLTEARNGAYFPDELYTYDAMGNRLALDVGGGSALTTYAYGYQYTPSTGSRLIVIDPPVEGRASLQMSKKEFRRRYNEFRRDYRWLLQAVKIWANAGFDEDEMPEVDAPPFMTFEELVVEFIIFNQRYAVDWLWWLEQVRKDTYVEELFYEFMIMLLYNNDLRFGNELTSDERFMVKELVRLLRNIEPAVPESWVIVDSGGMSVMSVTGEGSYRETYLDYEPNGNMIGMRTYEEGELVEDVRALYTDYNQISQMGISEIPLVMYEYNYLNQRVKKSTAYPTESRRFVYDLSGNMIMERTSRGDWREYIYLGGHRIAMLAKRVEGEPTPPGVVERVAVRYQARIAG